MLNGAIDNCKMLHNLYFCTQGIIHPAVARIIWSDHCDSLSPYRFCYYVDNPLQENHTCSWSCSDTASFWNRLHVLDFAGGGAVHLIGWHRYNILLHTLSVITIVFLGGMAGLVICLFAKFEEWKESKRASYQRQVSFMVQLHIRAAMN